MIDLNNMNKFDLKIRLDYENFPQHFEGIIMSSKTLRTGIQKAPYKKNYEINSGASS